MTVVVRFMERRYCENWHTHSPDSAIAKGHSQTAVLAGGFDVSEATSDPIYSVSNEDDDVVIITTKSCVRSMSIWFDLPALRKKKWINIPASISSKALTEVVRFMERGYGENWHTHTARAAPSQEDIRKRLC